MSKEPIKNGFAAEKCIFQCEQGYIVKQWSGGTFVCSQFIPAEAFRVFCDAVGIDMQSVVFL